MTTSAEELPELPEPELFAGERLTFGANQAIGVSEQSDSQINSKYVAGETRIVTEQARYPLNTIAGMVDSDDYELNPDFQRRHRWSPEKQSRLIESFIMNVPVPPIFLYEDQYSHYEVMDGLQRLTAISSFYKNELSLTGLTEWAELNGRAYSQLPDKIRRGVDRRYLSSIILLQETAKTAEEAERLKQLVFERINSGGVALKEQETRNAIYNGRLNQLCITLSRNVYLCKMWGIPEPTQAELEGNVPLALEDNNYYRTMFDVELVLRFFAHRQRRRIGTGALRTYLDSYLKQGNLFQESTLSDLQALFERTVKLVYDVLGEGAFWLWRYRHNKWGWLERPTTTAYDAIMFVFSQNLYREPLLRSKTDAFQQAIPGFFERYVDSFDARMTNMRNLRERDALVTLFVNGIVGAQ